jgi:hypothetical protein
MPNIKCTIHDYGANNPTYVKAYCIKHSLQNYHFLLNVKQKLCQINSKKLT